MLIDFGNQIISAGHIESFVPSTGVLHLFSGDKRVLLPEQVETFLWLIRNKLLGVPVLDIKYAAENREVIQKSLDAQKEKTTPKPFLGEQIPGASPFPPSAYAPSEKLDEILSVLRQHAQPRNNVIEFPKK